MVTGTQGSLHPGNWNRPEKYNKKGDKLTKPLETGEGTLCPSHRGELRTGEFREIEYRGNQFGK